MSSNSTTGDDTATETWQPFFPHPTAYDQQTDAINRVRDLVKEQGYFLMEGPCGTGKTTVALTAALSTISDPKTQFANALVATPLRKQRAQFITELTAINRQLLDEHGKAITALDLSNKHEYLPYARENIGEYRTADDTEAYALSHDIKERTNNILEYDNGYEIPIEHYPEEATTTCNTKNCVATAPNDIGACQEHASDADLAETSRSVSRAKAITDRINNVYASEDRLTVAGVTTPWPDTMPHLSSIIPDIDPELDGPINPFRIGYYADPGFEIDPTDVPQHIFTVDALVSLTAEQGICPYRVLYDLLMDDDTMFPSLIIGNYNHVIDPSSRFVLEHYRDHDTMLIMDEAHVLEESARSALSTTRGFSRLQGPTTEWEAIKDLVNSPGQSGKAALNILNRHGFDRRTIIKEIQDYFTEAKERLGDEIQFLLENEFDLSDPSDRPSDEHSIEIGGNALGNDFFTEILYNAAQEKKTWGEIYTNLGDIAGLLQALYKRAGGEEYAQIAGTARFFAQWKDSNRDEYMRHFTIEARFNTVNNTDWEWEGLYNGKLELMATIPRKELHEQVFSVFGGGIAMSATLCPIAQFSTACGFSRLYQEDNRKVISKTYPLRFDQANRKTFIPKYGSLPKFTSSNRGDPTTNYADMTPTRKQYAEVLTDMATTYGNHLYCLPSGEEAEWLADLLKASTIVKKDVYLDTPGDDGVLDRFRASDDAILVTYMRGTLTTGVDFDGDDLHTAVVVGVAYPPQNARWKAIEAAYEEVFGDGWVNGVSAPVVREARQAIGRVIRGTDELGVRIFLDPRYAFSSYDSLFPEAVRDEHETLTPSDIQQKTHTFWDFANTNY